MKGKEMILLQKMHNHRCTTKPKKYKRNKTTKIIEKTKKKTKQNNKNKYPLQKNIKNPKQNQQEKTKKKPKV